MPGDIPPTLSFGNLTWYFWNILNSQLLLPLFLLLVAGTAWLAVTLFRHRRETWARSSERHRSPARARPDGCRQRQPMNGARGARRPRGPATELRPADEPWREARVLRRGARRVAGDHATPSHDIRYAIPLLPYLAVLATGWIVHLPRAASWAAIAVLALGVVANTLGTTFGVGKTEAVTLVNPPPAGEEYADTVILLDRRLPGRRRRTATATSRACSKPCTATACVPIAWSAVQSREPDFDTEGLLPLTRIAELSPIVTGAPEFRNLPNTATLLHLPVTAGSPPPCTRFTDGTGVWVARYNPASGKVELYCPYRSPQFYGTLPAGA